LSRKFKFESTKEKPKVNLFSCGEDFIDTDMVKGPHIELFSNREIIIDGCCGVFEYKDSYVKLNLGKGALILCGTDFDIVTFEKRTITVKGKISSIEFCV